MTKTSGRELSEGGARYWGTWISAVTAFLGISSAVVALLTYRADEETHHQDQLARAQNFKYQNDTLRLQSQQLQAGIEQGSRGELLAVLESMSGSAAMLTKHPKGQDAQKAWQEIENLRVGKYNALGGHSLDLSNAYQELGKYISDIPGGLDKASPDDEKEIRRLSQRLSIATGRAWTELLQHH